MTTNTALIRLAILGSGIFAKVAHLPAIAELKEKVALVANWSRSDASSQDFQSYASNEHQVDVKSYHGEDGLQSLLDREDIDGVVMALPITSQPAVVLQCLAAGKHVLSEKPIAETVKRAKDLVSKYEQTYQGKGLIWEIAEQFYHEPRYQRVKQIIDSGKLGRVLFFTQVVSNHMEKGSKYHSTSWRTVPDYQGGFLLDGGVHFVAGLAAMLGPIASVSGTSTLQWEHLAPKDTIHAICRTEEGIEGTLTMSMGSAPTLSRTETIIACERGHIELLAGADKDGGWRLSVQTTDSNPIVEFFPSRGVYHEIESFAEKIRAVKNEGKSADSATARKALLDLAFIQACLSENEKWKTLKEL